MTIADVWYYNEIVTLVNLTKRKIDEGTLPHLYAWFYERMQIPEIKKLDEELKKIIAKYSLQ